MRNSLIALVLIHIIFCNSFLAAQNWTQKIISTEGDDNPYCVRQVSDGSILIAGSTSLYGDNDINVLFLKISPDGDITWSNSYGGPSTDFARTVIESESGDYIIFGSSYSFSGGDKDMYLLAIDTAGNLLWSQTYGGWQEERGFSITETSDNGFLLAGTSSSHSLNYNDGCIIKVNSTGSIEWSRIYNQGQTLTITGISEEISNEFYVYGLLYDYQNHQGDCYIMKTDNSGYPIWVKQIGGPNYEYARTMLLSEQNELFVCGHTESGSAGMLDMFLVKLSGSGELLWGKTFGGTQDDYGSSFTFTSGNNILFAGHTSSYGMGDRSICLIEFDDEGDSQWGMTYGGTGTEKLSFGGQQNMIVGENDNILFFGSTNSFLSNGFNDIFVVYADEYGASNCNEQSFTPQINTFNPNTYNISLSVFDGSISQTIANTETTELLMADSNICGITPIADFDFEIIDTTTVQFINLSQNAEEYKWTFNDGDISYEEDPMHTFSYYGEHEVTLIAYNTFTSDTCTKTIDLCELPDVSFYYDYDGINHYFYNQTVNYDSVHWDFGDGNYSSAENPVYSFPTPGEHMVTLTAYNGCGSDSYSEMVLKLPLPIADFSFEINNTTVQFTNLSENATNYRWDYGDHHQSQLSDPEHFYSENGTYLVSLTAYNEIGKDSVSKYLNVNGEELFEAIELIVFPNPTDKNLRIRLTNIDILSTEIFIYDARGRFVKHTNLVVANYSYIDVSDLAPGMYFLDLYGGMLHRTTKIMKIF